MMADVPDKIAQLVETFEQNLQAYKSQYNETQLRREFIDPFFEALGWDVANKKGYAPAYKDVIHEDAIKVGGATKAPDYCFRIGGSRKFFLEAKKPSVDVKHDPHPAYQLRRYAWSGKLPLSILTDFEEFAVYDCRDKPKQTDRAATARIMYLTYKEYVDRWDEIGAIFSKDAILKGSFDKYAVETKGKRGTSTVDKEFLSEIERWREWLAKSIALRNRELSRDEINFAVQRTIDRILFLRMCEDRGIETYSQLRTVTSGSDVYPRLCEIFRQADAKYNSGLFYFHKEKGRHDAPDELTPNIVIDDGQLRLILKSLYYPQCPYEFSVLPAEILGNVYEQFLGKVIRITSGRRAVVEPKPEVKKAGGVYYTPSYIVDYIVKNTVGKLCEGKTPTQIAKIKILDPACGSGSFLLGAYTYLLNYCRDWYVENNPEKHTKKIYQGRGGQWFLTIAEKKRILLDNIFGVDIDSQAVEVTKLSLLLKVLEGENKETVQGQLFAHERALPDLGDNIKCGNSLIGPDFFDNPDIDSSDEELVKRINAFDWQKEFPQIFSRKNPGFDAVIGNPPYIQLAMAQYFNSQVTNYVSMKYLSSMGRQNTFGFFIAQALSLLSKKGCVSYIVPNTLLTQQYYRPLRQLILTSRIESLTSYLHPVFDKAVVETVVFVVCKASPNHNRVKIVEYDSHTHIYRHFTLPQELYYKTHANSFLVRADQSTLQLKKKIDDKTVPLEKLTNINQAIALKRDRAESLFAKKEGDNFKRVLDGRNIQRYSLVWDGNYLAYDKDKIHSCKRIDIFEAPEKIFFRRVGSGLVATYDNEQYYALNTLVVITLREQIQVSLKYILGIVNSCLMSFYYVTFLKSTKKVFSEIQARQLAQLPIRVADPPNRQAKNIHDQIVKTVSQMLDLHKRLSAAKVPDEKNNIQRQIDATDKKIDEVVYELYGLTDDEIKLVEESTK